MKTAIDALKSKNVKGVVIDVRDNPGGLLDQVIKVCQMLIPKGPIVHIHYKTQPEETYASTLAKAPFKVVMLINGGSASASEIMAGAIKESGTGKLLGEKSYGKGTVQTIMNLGDGSGLKITIANYLTPKKFSLDGIGITPDIEVKSNVEDILKELAPIKGDRSIKSNLVGLDVLGLQERLHTLGYKITNESGVFDNTTKVAVLKFQKDNKLKQDASMEASDIKVLDTKFIEKLKTQDNQLTAAITELKKMLK
jgi:carboxyl-terminal processing protease